MASWLGAVAAIILWLSFAMLDSTRRTTVIDPGHGTVVGECDVPRFDRAPKASSFLSAARSTHHDDVFPSTENPPR